MHGLSARARGRIAAAGAALIALPWSAFVVAVYGRDAWRSTLILERFPDTNNPGYFIVKLAVVLMACLVAAQAVVEISRVVAHTQGDGA